MFQKIKISNCMIALFASVFLAFGLYQIHSMSGVTEGGVLGMTLLLDEWFHVSPAFSGLVMNLFCYVFGWKMLGREFILYSLVSTAGFSVSYKIFEQFTPLWPELYQTPLAAAFAGAVFVGIGAGLCVRAGGAPSGDDALAMALSSMTGVGIQWIYLVSDLIVLGLSLSYIPFRRLGFSLLTVLLSGQIIGWIQEAGKCEEKSGRKNEVN